MRKIVLALALSLWSGLAFGQCNGVFPANTLCGNLTGSPAPPSAFVSSGTIAGPVTSTLNGLPLWANTLGSMLKDGAGSTVAGNYTWSGSAIFNGTLTGSIGNTTPQPGAFTTLSAIGALTFPNNSLTLAQFPTIATSTVVGYFGGGTGTPIAASVPSCANDGTHALVNNAGGGFSCVTISAAPTVQTFTSGSSQPYSAPAGLVRIKVRMVGGGGGGGAVTTNAGAVGTDTSFCSWTAIHGNGGSVSGGTNSGGAGGTSGVNSTGTLVARFTGANGSSSVSWTSTIIAPGGDGGQTPFGGRGAGGMQAAGLAAKANTGSGGGGGGSGSAQGGAGGGAGEYVEFWMTAAQICMSPTYTVGGGGNGGAAGGQAGGNGAAGIIIIEEFYI